MGNCCSEGKGSCRCNFRLAQSSFSICCVKCCGCCVKLPSYDHFRTVPAEDMRWRTGTSAVDALLEQIRLSRIVPLDVKTMNTIESPGPGSSTREPFVAHLTISLDPENNKFLLGNPDELKLCMNIDGGIRSDLRLSNNSTREIDVLDTEFHFVLDRSMTTLDIALRENPYGGIRRLCGDGHKVHEWRVMIDGSLEGPTEPGLMDYKQAVCVEMAEEPEHQDCGLIIAPGFTKVTLNPTSSSDHEVVLLVKYEHLRGTPDGGNVVGPGYLAVEAGKRIQRPDHTISEHWVCSHDNMLVVGDDASAQRGLMDMMSEQLGVTMDRVAMAEALTNKLQYNSENWNDSDFVSAARAIMEEHIDVEERPNEHTEVMEMRRTVGQMLAILHERVADLEYDKSLSKPTIQGRWMSSGSELGQMCAIVVPVDKWATLKPIDPETAIEKDDPFWKAISRSIITPQDTANGSGPFSIPLPFTNSQVPGLYTVRMFRDDSSYGMGNLFLLEKGTQCVVFDCDGTLTTGDHEVVTQFVFSPTYDPERYNAAATMVRSWAAKGYQVVYVSGRQGTMYNWTMSWLIKHGFPPGPIHLTRTSVPTLPYYASVGHFKVEYLKELQAKGLEIYAAYGNTATDVRAYEEAEIPKERTYIMGPAGGIQSTQAVENWESAGFHSHIKEVWKHPDATVPVPYTSLDWGAALWGYEI
eukprot:TRINITY_DN14292_c0_g1_i1.p1 TRINITY_DN14292_c0_g1~~TRINITY_DN14292_c0_g1_i1.p1  ORF type:complete len:695 (+),score=124.19 TRINITY_DN14292_c0_g1_i1:133-2217(+)